MKSIKKMQPCEYCDRDLLVDSPPPQDAYERGEICIGGSSILLPASTVAAKHVEGVGDSHMVSIEGRYCGLQCLISRIEEILCVPPAKRTTLK